MLLDYLLFLLFNHFFNHMSVLGGLHSAVVIVLYWEAGFLGNFVFKPVESSFCFGISFLLEVL